MSDNLTAKTGRAISWNILSVVVSALLQIVNTTIMARLLSPSAYGLIALSDVVLRFGSYFADLGVGQAIIQKKEVNKYDIRSAFTFSLLLGSTFTLFFYFFAPFSTEITREPETIPVIRWMAVTFFVRALGITSNGLLSKAMNFKTVSIINIISFAFGYILVGITLAYFDYGVYSLVFAALSQAIIQAGLSYFNARHSLLPLLRIKYIKPIFSYGSKFSFISFIEFLIINSDSLLIGRFLGVEKLGFYNRAQLLNNLPIHYLKISISSVLFPAFSSIQNEVERLKTVFVKSISTMQFVVMPTFLGLSIASNTVVMIVLGEKWITSVPIIQILSLTSPFLILNNFFGVLSDSLAYLKNKLLIQLFHLGILASLFYLFREYNLLGFAYAILLSKVVNACSYFILFKKKIGMKFTDIIVIFKYGLVNSLLIGLVFYGIKYAGIYFDLPHLVLFFIYLISGGLMLFLFLFLRVNKPIREDLTFKIGQMMGENNRIFKLLKTK